MRPWLNWIEHLTTDQKVEGSNPSGRARNSTAVLYGGLIYVQAPGFEPEQQGSTMSRFGKHCAAKSSRMPRSRHILCRARESFWARQEFNRRVYGGLIYVPAPGFKPEPGLDNK